MKYGVFSVSMPEYDPEETLKVLKELGYDGVEWRGMACYKYSKRETDECSL